MPVLGLGWRRSFQGLGQPKFKKPAWVPTDCAISEATWSASVGLVSVLAHLQHHLEVSSYPC